MCRLVGPGLGCVGRAKVCRLVGPGLGCVG